MRKISKLFIEAYEKIIIEFLNEKVFKETFFDNISDCHGNSEYPCFYNIPYRLIIYYMLIERTRMWPTCTLIVSG